MIYKYLCFFSISLLLISNFFCCVQRTRSIWFQCFKFLQTLYNPVYGLFWWVVHVHLKIIYILFWGGMFYKCSVTVKLVDVVVSFFSILMEFSFYSTNYWEKRIEIFQVLLWVYFQFQFCQFLLCVFLKLWLSTYTFMIIISHLWWNDPVIIMRYFSLSLVIFLVLKYHSSFHKKSLSGVNFLSFYFNLPGF